MTKNNISIEYLIWKKNNGNQEIHAVGFVEEYSKDQIKISLTKNNNYYLDTELIKKHNIIYRSNEINILNHNVTFDKDALS